MSSIHELPLEVLSLILHNIKDIKNIKSFMMAYKRCNLLDTNFFWKRKCLLDYNYQGNCKNYKLKYKVLYNNLCIICLKKTKHINSFYNERVCLQCEKINEKYLIIYKTHAIKNFFLKEKDLENIPFIMKKNRYNFKYPVKLYLKKDVLSVAYNKYTKYELDLLTKKRLLKDYKKIMNIVFRYRIICGILYTEYNIDFLRIQFLIDDYSDGLYSKIMKNLKLRIDPLIYKCLELDFIIKIERRFFIYNITKWKENFKESLTEFILTSMTCNIYTYKDDINSYIMNMIKDILIQHKVKYLRKLLVLEYIPETYFNVSTVRDFILNGTMTIEQLIKIIKIQTFFSDYTNFDQEYLDGFMAGSRYISTDMHYQLYIKLLNKWYMTNKNLRHLIPKECFQYLQY